MAVRGFVLAALCVLALGHFAAASDCPDGSSFFKCMVQPCSTMRCAAGYTCKDDYCGGCHGRCVPVNDGKVNIQINSVKNVAIKPFNANTCPDGSKPVNCLMNPCAAMLCPMGQVGCKMPGMLQIASTTVAACEDMRGGLNPVHYLQHQLCFVSTAGVQASDVTNCAVSACLAGVRI